MSKLLVGAKTGVQFESPIELSSDWSVKALPDLSKIILMRHVCGIYMGAVTIDEVSRTYAFGMATEDRSMEPYSGRNWRKRLYLEATNALIRLLS